MIIYFGKTNRNGNIVVIYSGKTLIFNQSLTTDLTTKRNLSLLSLLIKHHYYISKNKLVDFENNKINNYYNEISHRFQSHRRCAISLHFHIRYVKYLI